jgi:peroxiredoxin
MHYEPPGAIVSWLVVDPQLEQKMRVTFVFSIVPARKIKNISCVPDVETKYCDVRAEYIDARASIWMKLRLVSIVMRTNIFS